MKCVLISSNFYPDNVISAIHFTDIALGLKERGFDVDVITSSYKWKTHEKIEPSFEQYKGINVYRCWKPKFLKDSSYIGRFLGSIVLSVSFFLKALFIKTDWILFGTNPPFAYFIIPLLKIFKRKTKLAIYGHDLYPEAMEAVGIRLPKWSYAILRWFAKKSYQSCDALIDIGECMRRRFNYYQPTAKEETIIPWALFEPTEIPSIDIEVRKAHFGDAKLGILYSGTVGVVHRFDEVLALARELRTRKADVAFCFAGYGNKYSDLKAKITNDDTNITFAGFIDEKDLGKRLSCSDLSLVTLEYGFDGISVPSKFFGAIAVGQPILYSGTEKSSLYDIVLENKIGYCLSPDNIMQIADELEQLSKNTLEINIMKQRAFELYNKNYKKSIACDKFADFLKKNI